MSGAGDGANDRRGDDDGTDDYDDRADSDDDVEWPVTLEGVTETVVTTLGPNGRWNAAALGLFAETEPAGRDKCEAEAKDQHASEAGEDDISVTARTWGNTRTRRNFHRRGTGYVQFTRDPVDFVDAALSIFELEEPTLESADAWVRVTVERIESGTEDGTRWEAWRLDPLESAVETETVPTINRGFGAVVEATVAASRLEVDGYDESVLRDRLEYYESVVDRAGSDREREALARVRECVDW
ncbi:DUF447 domain-containing protein [Halostagnicola kamekurae]|uniref:DUF447 family protein n=1 Tax=Halostagnicola kamekurae TaxID=619731 RepID=A0A1I6SXR5_9EURY|nr:DUF447 domain-containing protein [Halostagnicola kamekurae]SFS81690.1 hypothetical protein SAMN04488556_2981 [Halostagnicola kamekurae]